MVLVMVIAESYLLHFATLAYVYVRADIIYALVKGHNPRCTKGLKPFCDHSKTIANTMCGGGKDTPACL